ncbi:MAG: CvpA family protein [Phycisphaerales bacterium]
MLFTVFALAAVLIFTWVWVIRGFFSAFLHLLCVLAAGAVAFAVYEPLTMLVLSQAPSRGIGTILRDTAHGVSLGLSFAISLALFRVVVDKIVPNNLKFHENVEYVGAGVCGLGTGVITVGFILMSLSMMRFGPDKPVQGLVFTQEGGGARGSVVRNSSPFRPYVDEWTAELYSWMSRGSLATSQPLAKWHPGFHEMGSAMRTTFAGQSRNASRPEEFKVIQWYALGDIDRGGSIQELMRDRWQNVQQRVIGLDGEEISNGYVAGVVVEFDALARELGGGAKIVLGNAQVRLVAEQGDTGYTRAFHPSAVISQADAEEPTLARFRFDADETFIASVGGGAKAIMAFDFALPRGYRPIAIYIRGARQQLEKQPDMTFSTTTARDDAVPTFEYGGVDLADMDASMAVRLETMRGREELDPSEYYMYLQNTLPGRLLIKKGTERGLEVFKGDSDRYYTIVGGIEQYTSNSLRGQFIDPALRVGGFAQSRDVRIVQVDVGRDSPLALNGPVFQNLDGNQAPMLVDDQGQLYPPVGYICIEDANTYIGFTPGQPITDLSRLPFTVSQSRAVQETYFIYRVSGGVNIQAMVAGNMVVATWEPGVEVAVGTR